jgi:hypothetical protein
MQLTTIVSYLVHPGKGLAIDAESPGVLVPLKGNLFDMLAAVYDKSDSECRTPVRFTMAPDGSPTNDARDALLGFINSHTLKVGRKLAHRLRDCTTKKSGLGLMFIMHGAEGLTTKVVVSRFPAEEGILAEEDKSNLKVEFIERIFMKNSASYKAALYQGESLDDDFWVGFVVDRQLNESADQIANYWIRDFLASDYKTTSKAGTRRLAIALREATHSGPVATKQEIVATITLAKGMFGKTVSIVSLMQQLSLSPEAQAAIITHLPDPSLIGDTFVLDREEFLENAPLAMVELHTGGLLLAPADRFDETFQREPLHDASEQYKFTTVGRIVDERLRGRRP